MNLQISAHNIEKSFGSQQLFQGLNFTIHQGQKRALLGPNGAGKSTLMKILANLEGVDGGEVSQRKGLSLAYVPQDESFPEQTVHTIVTEHLREQAWESEAAQVQASIYLSRAGFKDFEQKAHLLSGGWRKRLSLACALAQDCELLLLDEPTNHLDWEGIFWLEGQLRNFSGSLLIISHDREFLKNLCQEFTEINPAYPNGSFSQTGSYESFLQKRQEFLTGEKSRQASLGNKVRRETEWLRAGVKARTTKSVSRMKDAYQLQDDLQELKNRNTMAEQRAQLRLKHAGLKAKQYFNIKNLSLAYGDKTLLTDLSLRLGPKQAIGVLGANASGKTTFVKSLAGSTQSLSVLGEINAHPDLKVIYFDQKRETLDLDSTGFYYLGEGSDHLNHLGESVHVLAYASRFLFRPEQLQQPIAKLSGGERARLVIAKLLTQAADVFILDEPTNDLDLNTIEILEESLRSFSGLILLVSHDRYFLRQICNQHLALDGKGGWTLYADLDQWLKQEKKSTKGPTKDLSEKSEKKNQKKKVKLSYKEKERLKTIEQEIADAETELEELQKDLQDLSDFSKAHHLSEELKQQQSRVDELYHTWQQLEEKSQGEG